MSLEFHAQCNPTAEALGEVAARLPRDPFSSPQYVASRQLQGACPWLFCERNGHDLVAFCIGFVSSGRLTRRLEIVSMFGAATSTTFWNSLAEFCRSVRIREIEISSRCSNGVPIPAIPTKTDHYARYEYELDLSQTDLWAALSHGHRYSIKRARKAGCQVTRATDAESCRQHVRLMMASMTRRNRRGETVPESMTAAPLQCYLTTGAGIICQAVLDGEVVSSYLVLLGKEGAYLQSGGSNQTGMRQGASTFLIHEISRMLHGMSKKVLNLGAATDDNPGLAQFKLGFGARPVMLETAHSFLGGMLLRRLISAVREMREDPYGFLRGLVESVEQFVAYSVDPVTVPPVGNREDLRVEELSDDSLLHLSNQRTELSHYGERFRKYGRNDAFAVFQNGQVVHVACLVTADHDRARPIRNVRLRVGEAEIADCITLPEFRGRGIYPYAIRSLCQLAAKRGIRRVYMITDVVNSSSQRGIEKAGLVRCGRITRHVPFPRMQARLAITYRGHRTTNGQVGWSRRDATKVEMNAGVLAKIKRSLHNRGLLGSIRGAIQLAVNRILATRLRRAIQKIHEGFDREYGVDTAATVSVSALGAHGRNVQHAVEYQAILPEAFAEVMKQLPIDFGQSVFIDFGSGKGRALLLASEFPFEKIVGVEFSPQLHGIAEANCRKYRSATQKCKTIELLCIDAVEYDIPPKPAVFYFYNPFHEEVMTQIAGKVDRSLRELPRKVFVVYFWAFWAERRRSLEGIEGLEPFPVCQPLWPGQSGREVVKVWVTKRNVCAPGESRKIEREIRR